jgi:plastocyanin
VFHIGAVDASMTRNPAIAAIAALALGLAGCGADDRAGAGAEPVSATDGPETVTVSIADFAFGPGRITVATGSTIRFENADGQAHTATATAPKGAFDTDRIDAGTAVEVTVGEAGEIAYFCAFHPFMEGTVVVA